MYLNFRRSGQGGYFLPLSGGVDSSSSAALVFSMCRSVSLVYVSLCLHRTTSLCMSVSVSLSFSVVWAVHAWSVYISVSLSGLMSLSLLLTVSLPIYLKKKNMVCKVIFCQIGC